MKFRPFNEARRFVQRLGIKSQNSWREYCRSGKKPEDIPADPAKFYKNEWKGIGDWLGTGSISPQDRNYRSFKDAKKFVLKLDLKSYDEWRSYFKSGKKPVDIPANPLQVYAEEWKGWGDWLGTGTVANQNRRFRPFKEARTFARSLGLKSKEDWAEYCSSGKKPPDIPQGPYNPIGKTVLIAICNMPEYKHSLK